ncbi:hypothetical protein HMPREF3160_03375 [Arthrobacter sp. HMSC06H05]|uniref:Fluoride-specific ion channel n=1 Tax=Pseudoglutamicibacter albus DNF00011 TaxID=1401063 RepID=A0A095ZS64_9MICC|nr:MULTISPECIES: CrcB family protein [Micrococcaceae]KGF21347.1 hypothetical protein HMPREF2128_01220 [Pseudoglutamicibacter albus DNF00011]KGF21470.1 hypothetical protein HMPREF2128_02025 [Pseudoglutamicibacter albus DNF00011]OFT43193.1 hypothetical protein HMPREF3160_03375 [Arthrobacter sp. HMSC06H05]
MSAWLTILTVSVAGGLGSVARVWFIRREEQARADGRITSKFPWGMSIANTLSCFIFGVFTGGFADQAWAVPVLAGFCGGFSTIASVATTAISSARERAWLRSFAILAAILCLAVPAAYLGLVIGKAAFL